jgi:hypothetical protein
MIYESSFACSFVLYIIKQIVDIVINYENALPLESLTPYFVAIFMFSGIAFSVITLGCGCTLSKAKRIFLFQEKGTTVRYLMGADGNPWTWVLGENDEASEDEKERSKLEQNISKYTAYEF